MPLKFKAKLNSSLQNIKRVDITPILLEAADIVAQEIRGNIKRGTDISEGVSHRLNSPDYAKRKLKELGHQKPLQAWGKALVNKSNYIIRKDAINKVSIRLSNSKHPKSRASIAEIGLWNDQGTNDIPSRHFFGISDTAKKRVVAKAADTVVRSINGFRR